MSVSAGNVADRLLSERDWQDRVVETARLYGWLVHHSRAAMRQDGKWMTPIQGDPGYLDLTLVRDRVLFRELKTEKGKLQPGQVVWLERLRQAGADADVWRPSDWSRVERELRQRD